MDAFQRLHQNAFARRQAAYQRQQRARRHFTAPQYAPPVIPQSYTPKYNRYGRQHFAGADEGLEGTFSSPDVIYGILPMVVAVGAGLWMALRG